MTRISLVEQAHNLIASHLKPGDIAIDATAGNGHDTLFLAQQVGPDGRVYSFDIQANAISNTDLKLHEAGLRERVELVHAGHQHWLDYIPGHHVGHISTIMFNLGYLPGGDKAITTLMNSTLQALQQAPKLLQATGGYLTIMAYPGHAQGKVELEAIDHWCQELNHEKFSVEKITLENTRTMAPQLFIINTCTEIAHAKATN